jgi:hypothetical protein
MNGLPLPARRARPRLQELAESAEAARRVPD